MQNSKRLVWTWCPKCMVRTKHEAVKTALQCQDCGCVHVGELIVPKTNLAAGSPTALEQARPAG